MLLHNLLYSHSRISACLWADMIRYKGLFTRLHGTRAVNVLSIKILNTTPTDAARRRVLRRVFCAKRIFEEIVHTYTSL